MNQILNLTFYYEKIGLQLVCQIDDISYWEMAKKFNGVQG
jgi:hypothetical protein